MKLEKTISKTVDEYSSDWPPCDAVGTLEWFKAKLNDIPQEFRETARIEISCEDSYGLSKTTIDISYKRLETDEEEVARERQAAADSERRRAEELRMLAALQEKYGTPKA